MENTFDRDLLSRGEEKLFQINLKLKTCASNRAMTKFA